MRTIIFYGLLLTSSQLYAFGGRCPPLKGSIVDACLGIDVTKWSTFYSRPSKDQLYDTSINPYVLKTLDVRFKNFYGIEAGLNYLATSFANAFNFESNETIDKTDSRAKQLQLFLSKWITGDFGVYVDTKFRKFEGTAKVLALSPLHTSINFYGDNGSAAQLQVGDTFGWATVAKEFAFMVFVGDEKGNNPSRILAGYRSFHHRAPMQIDIHVPDNVNLASDALFITDVNVHSFEVALDLRSDGSSGLGYSLYLPVSLGAYDISNAYFDSSSTFMVLAAFDASVSLGGQNWKIITGFHLNYMWGIPINYNKVTVTKDMPYTNISGSGVYKKGSEIEIVGNRSELFWGPYLSASMHF